MSERYGADYIYDVLSNDSSITTIVGSSIYEDTLIPQSDTTQDTINFYRPGPYNPKLEYFENRWSVDCRRPAYGDSLDLATLVKDAFNRNFATVNSKYYFSVVDILPTIPPVNDSDVYNTPVEIYVRRK